MAQRLISPGRSFRARRTAMGPGQAQGRLGSLGPGTCGALLGETLEVPGRAKMSWKLKFRCSKASKSVLLTLFAQKIGRRSKPLPIGLSKEVYLGKISELISDVMFATAG